MPYIHWVTLILNLVDILMDLCRTTLVDQNDDLLAVNRLQPNSCDNAASTRPATSLINAECDQ